MIGNEKINPDAKFVELFRRVSQLEAALRAAEERLAEHHSVINFVPPGLRDDPPKRKTLTLTSGTR